MKCQVVPIIDTTSYNIYIGGTGVLYVSIFATPKKQTARWSRENFRGSPGTPMMQHAPVAYRLLKRWRWQQARLGGNDSAAHRPCYRVTQPFPIWRVGSPKNPVYVQLRWNELYNLTLKFVAIYKFWVMRWISDFCCSQDVHENPPNAKPGAKF